MYLTEVGATGGITVDRSSLTLLKSEKVSARPAQQVLLLAISHRSVGDSNAATENTTQITVTRVRRTTIVSSAHQKVRMRVLGEINIEFQLHAHASAHPSSVQCDLV
jgi:hypothetical protein